ncbi:Qat anti-phage system ATPase QatA [Sulfuricurvum sp.]|uniref:Qat anti-phage system ATPase QatA n=1 Tax=Sulfuricurvum sp. TaxID=2025608 RepID=UPI00261751A7|nr:Qat anti-phage system ATPase QatA [Sulfuricurvum sp.]MDD3595585.1 P-loop NTPase fold protein [Sulfuricurvum sp.]
MVLHDNETAIDFLYYESIAQTIKELLDDADDKPMTIGIHGDWGAGKSSILAMIEAAYLKDEKVLCLKFNGWLFQGFEDAKLVLLEKVIAEVTAARSTTGKVKATAKSLFKRINWMKAAKTTGQMAFTYLSGIPSPELLTEVNRSAKNIIEHPIEELSLENLKKLVEPFKGFINDEIENSNIPHEMHAFRQEFEELLEEANIDQLVVIIDDLDRCLPKTTIETLEALRLFLFVPKTAFIIAADEAMIEYAVKQHFPNLPNTVGATSYARNYLEKLIQVPFRIPALGATETLTYVILLLTLRSLGETSPGFNALKELSREAIQKPWLGNSLSMAVLDEAISDDNERQKAREAFNLAKQISQTINDGTAGNPRQIKRFINSLMLRKQIAHARGFGAEINLNVLAKIMLAESFHPEFYRQLNNWTSISPDGKLKELKSLERSDSGTEGEFSESSEIKQDDWTKQWANANPKLSDIDLRPYLFVTRDRKVKSGVIMQSDDLQELADKLLGSEMAIAGLKGEIEILKNPEAEKLYLHLESAIITNGNLKDKPDGVSGINLLLKTHTFLQVKYCSMLDSLDVDNLGTWVVIPIDVFSEHAAKQQYTSLLTRWKNQDTNKQLSTFAEHTLKLIKGN